MIHKLYPLFLSFIFIMSACSQADSTNTDDFSKCKFGKPNAIFSPKMNGITAHLFQIKERTGIEQVEFDNGKKLELIQTGCNEINQELIFTLPPTKNIDWVEMAASELEFLSTIDDELKPFSFWAGAISAKKNEFKLGQDVELEPNIFANIDRIESSDRVLLKITLSQKS